MSTIQQAVVSICEENDITTRDDLYRWCDGLLLWTVEEIGWGRMYELVHDRAIEHWVHHKNPKSAVRTKLQSILIGYKRFTARTPTTPTPPTTTPLERARSEMDTSRAVHDVALEKYETAQKRVVGLREALRIAEVEAATQRQELGEARSHFYGALGDWQRLC